MRPPVSATLLGLWLCLSSSAVCQNKGTDQNKPPFPEYIQEFFLSDAVRNQERGEFQLAVGLDARRTTGTNTTVKMEYGVTDRLQVGLDLPYGVSQEENFENSSGLKRMNLGVRYQIIKSDAPFAISVGIDSGIPISSGEEVAFQPTILAAKSIRHLQIHASAAADFEIGEDRPGFEYNFGSVYPIHRFWFPTLEFNARNFQSKEAFYLTPGLYRRVRHRFEVGVGIPLGIGGSATSGIVCKLSWEIGGHESK
jgi:hypothetical protein